MKRLLLGVVLALVAFTSHLQAVGTVTVATTTVSDRTGVYRRYTVSWTSTAGGAVSGNAFAVVAGKLSSIRFVPGATTPTDLYDVVLTDGAIVDMLAGAGADCLAASSVLKQWDPPLFQDGTRTLDVVISNAGNAKNGTVVLLIQVQ